MPHPNCPGVASGTMSYLMTHIKTVHEKRRDYACPYCEGVAFGRKSCLERHHTSASLRSSTADRRISQYSACLVRRASTARCISAPIKMDSGGVGGLQL
jgi:hypothetical protein